MKKIFRILFYMSIFVLLSAPLVHSHLCDNVFRQADKLIVKPENYNIMVKDKTTFKIFLQNNMDRGIDEISLLADSPAFDFKISPEKMTLPKDQKVFFTVTMHSKSDTKTGYYPIHFRLVGGGREFESFSLDVQSSAPEKEAEKRDVVNLLVVRPTRHTLQLDGMINDELWKAASVASNFSSAEGGSAVHQTIVLLTFDGENLYFGIHCSHDEIEGLSEADKVEVRFATDPPISSYYSVTLSAVGTSSFKKVLQEGGISSWGPHIEYAAGKEGNCWAAEVSIPFSAFNLEAPISPEEKKIYMRIERTKVAGEAETSYWSADSSGYNREDGFGEFILMPEE